MQGYDAYFSCLQAYQLNLRFGTQQEGSRNLVSCKLGSGDREFGDILNLHFMVHACIECSNEYVVAVQSKYKQ